MKNTLMLGLLCGVTALIGAGCLLGPKKDPKLVAEIDRAFSARSSETYGPAGPVPWELGQWVLIVNTDEKGNRSSDRYQLVSRQGDDFWLELERTAPDRKSYSAMLITNYDPQNLKNARVEKLKILGENGEVIETNPENNGPGQNIMQLALTFATEAANSLIATMQQDESTGAPEEITVPAGTFQGARKAAVSYQFSFGGSKGFIWYAPVPIVNYARQEVDVTALGFSAGKSISEIADFGKGEIRSVFFPTG